MNQYIIGIDIGTGSTKAVMLDSKAKPVAISQVFYKTDCPQTGYAEQNPEIIWKAFIGCIKKVVAKKKRLPVTVSISAAMHSMLVVDKKNKLLTPLITWEDTRSEKIAEALRNSLEGENIYKSTGAPIHSMLPLCKIKWLKVNEKKIFEQAFKFISIKEFIWFRLFNKYEIDYSIASATGLFNIENKKWHTPSLQFCGITESQLSEAAPTHFIRKDIPREIAAAMHVSADSNFCIGASDGCLANLGTNVINHGIAALTIGTSGAVRIAINKPIVNYESMIFNYILDEKKFISGAPINNGGNILPWLFKNFLNNANPSENDYKKFFKTIEAIPVGCNGLMCLPYLYGERAPVWDEKASAIFLGIKSFHTNAYFLRAALEGICFTLKNIVEILEATTAPIKQLNVSGGFIHSKTWMQILSDITGKNLCLVQTEDASSIGAALLCMKALKIIAGYDSLPQNAHIIIKPNSDNFKIYKKYYAVFKNVYPSTKTFLHELHQIKIKN